MIEIPHRSAAAASRARRGRARRRRLALLVIVWQTLSGSIAFADSSADPLLDKAEWQRRYHALRVLEARLIKTIELATKEYADANRRNYRRSGVRHFHRTNANEAKEELKRLREQIEQFRQELVAAGGSLYWLDEIDEEPIDPDEVQALGEYRDGGRFGGEGAYGKDSPASPSDEDLDLGRNPRFLSEDEEIEERLKKLESRFDYDAWRTDRPDYERHRAPERHLRPGED